MTESSILLREYSDLKEQKSCVVMPVSFFSTPILCPFMSMYEPVGHM